MGHAEMKLQDAPGKTNTGRGQRIAAVAVGSVGVVSMGVGAVLGLQALARSADSRGQCNGANVCEATGVALREEAGSRGNGSTAAIIVGAVAAAGGVALWFTAPAAPVRPGVGAVGSGAGLLVGGAF